MSPEREGSNDRRPPPLPGATVGAYLTPEPLSRRVRSNRDEGPLPRMLGAASAAAPRLPKRDKGTGACRRWRAPCFASRRNYSGRLTPVPPMGQATPVPLAGLYPLTTGNGYNTVNGMDTTTSAAILPVNRRSPDADATPAWRVRAMLTAVAWARQARIPYSPFLAVKVLR